MPRDLLSAFRWLRRNPLFTGAITAILALGIGTCTAVFSIVDAVLLRPLPYKSSRELIRIEENSTKRAMFGIPAKDYLLWSSRRDLFQKTAAYRTDVVTVIGAGAPDQLRTQRVSAGLFSMLGVQARLGRTLMDFDGEPNAPNTVVLSDRMWQRVFDADPGVVGKVITVAGEIHTIVGVMAPEFDFPWSGNEMWLPLRLTPAFAGGLLQAVARLKPGVSMEQVQSALAIVADQLGREDPIQKASLEIKVSPWRETVERQYELTLIFILVAVGLVLLIACANAAGLLLSRAVQRQKEIAIRTSLGAPFWRILRQMLAESLVLAVLGSITGIIGAHYLLQCLSGQMAVLPITIPHLQRVALNERVLLFNTLLCVALSFVFSFAPSVFTSRADLQSVLRTGHGAGGDRGSARLFSILIASEAAFAFLLLVGSGLMLHSLIRLQQADHGLHPDHVLTMRVPVGSLTQPRSTGKYDTKPRQMAYYRELLERLQRMPGVRAAAVVNNLPLSGFNTSTRINGADHTPTLVATRTISPDYFSVMGIARIAGRFFSVADQTGSPPVAIINEYLAKELFPNHDPIGQSLSEADAKDGLTIVGVVRDSPQNSYEQPAKGEVYLPYQQAIFGAFLSTIIVRTSGEPLSLTAALRKEVWAVDPDQPIVKVETMNDVIAESIWRPRFSAWLFSVLGGLALLLTSAGVYGVVAYTTGLRTREIGIRVALGATPRTVVTLILRDAMIPLAVGLAISLVAALLLSRLLASILYEISGTDPFAYLGAAALVLVIGAIASARPAWKAAIVDPLAALRAE